MYERIFQYRCFSNPELEERMNNLKIVQLAPYYYPEVGGMEGVVKCVSEELVKRNHEVVVYTYNIDKSGNKAGYEERERINDVRVKRFNPIFNIHYGSFSPALGRELSKEREVDVVHAHGYRHPFTEQAWLKKKNKAKLVLHSHSPFYPKETTPFLAWLWYKFYDKISRYTVFKYYDKVVALTPHDKKKLIERGCPKKKIEVMYNPLPNKEEIDQRVEEISKKDVGKFKEKYGLNGNPLILYLGRVAETKKVGRIIKALPKVEEKENNINAQLAIVGPDEGYLKRLKRVSNELGVEEKVSYLGEVSEWEKSLAYLSSDLYVLPSQYEGYGITLLEAQAHRTPVIAFEDGGQKYAVKNGETIKKYDPKLLAEKITEVSKLNPPKIDLKEPSEFVDDLLEVYER